MLLYGAHYKARLTKCLNTKLLYFKWKMIFYQAVAEIVRLKYFQ